MPVCNKCDGQGMITVVGSRLNTEETVGLAFVTFGLSLLFMPKLKEKICPRCGGYGKVGIDLIEELRK